MKNSRKVGRRWYRRWNVLKRKKTENKRRGWIGERKGGCRSEEISSRISKQRLDQKVESTERRSSNSPWTSLADIIGEKLLQLTRLRLKHDVKIKHGDKDVTRWNVIDEWLENFLPVAGVPSVLPWWWIKSEKSLRRARQRLEISTRCYSSR